MGYRYLVKVQYSRLPIYESPSKLVQKYQRNNNFHFLKEGPFEGHPLRIFFFKWAPLRAMG